MHEVKLIIVEWKFFQTAGPLEHDMKAKTLDVQVTVRPPHPGGYRWVDTSQVNLHVCNVKTDLEEG